MNFLKYVAGLAVSITLSACGGGGGNPGTSSGAPVSTTAAPLLTLQLLDESGRATNSISTTGLTTVRASLKTAGGVAVAQKLLTVAGDATQLKFPDGLTMLTDSSGTAAIKVGRASITAVGAGNLTITYSYTSDATATAAGTSKTITETLGYQLSPLNVALNTLNLGATALPALGTRTISVSASINGAAATNDPVQITFSAGCGTVTPSVVTTGSSGTASTTYTATLNCAGTNVAINASAVGASPVSGTIAVASSIATNVQFVSTTPQLIYLKDSVGTTQAQVVFKAVDSSGNPLQNKKLRLSLTNIDTGVSLDTLGNVSPVDLSTDSLGLVSVAVFSGTVPTSLNVKATLLDSSSAVTSVFSNSNLLTVASGRPTQSSLSLALGKLSLEGLNYDGDSTTVTLSMADRQGNPVPPGTQVNFVTESGVLLPAVCFVAPATPATASSPAIPTSACSVTIKTSGTRPANGRVSILAYVAGEEDFVDVNGNNVYDSGEPFTDLGRAFRDDNGTVVSGANGSFDTGEFQVPRAGVAVCTQGTGCPGDGVWGAADVRRQATIIFASGVATIAGTPSTSGITVTISDANGNSVPTGSTIVATMTDLTSGLTNCTLTSASSATVFNTLLPTAASFGFKDCATGDQVNIKVTTPLGTITSRDFAIP